jgi:hypothetical protein
VTYHWCPATQNVSLSYTLFWIDTNAPSTLSAVSPVDIDSPPESSDSPDSSTSLGDIISDLSTANDVLPSSTSTPEWQSQPSSSTYNPSPSPVEPTRAVSKPYTPPAPTQKTQANAASSSNSWTIVTRTTFQGQNTDVTKAPTQSSKQAAWSTPTTLSAQRQEDSDPYDAYESLSEVSEEITEDQIAPQVFSTSLADGSLDHTSESINASTLVAVQSNSPGDTPNSENVPIAGASVASDGTLDGSAKAGLAIGVLAAIAVLLIALFFGIRRFRARKKLDCESYTPCMSFPLLKSD